MQYAYPCNIVPDHEEKAATGIDAWVVSFPDVYGANTGADTWGEALDLAEDCLGVALGAYIRAKEDIPIPGPLVEGQVSIPVPLLVAAKLTLYTAMRERGITQTALAKTLGVDDREVRRMLDPGYKTHIAKLEQAVRAVGQALVVEARSSPS